MTADDAALTQLFRAIVTDDMASAAALLDAAPDLSTRQTRNGATRQTAAEHYIADIEHYLYVGDTALHVAAAAHRPALVRLLLRTNADVDARNRRGAAPLHYAADGSPGSPTWDSDAQAETINCLLEAGAFPDATDRSGVTPLHRAVRTRCAASVKALLEGGADPQRPNGRGSTPRQLAIRPTGRGGSGSAEARAQQAQILELLG